MLARFAIILDYQRSCLVKLGFIARKQTHLRRHYALFPIFATKPA
jgi:hypothetical protein